MEIELKKTKNLSNKIDDVDEMGETYKGFDELYELYDKIQDEIDVCLFQKKSLAATKKVDLIMSNTTLELIQPAVNNKCPGFSFGFCRKLVRTKTQ